MVSLIDSNMIQHTISLALWIYNVVYFYSSEKNKFLTVRDHVTSRR